MATFNKSEILKSAWNLVKTSGLTISEGLRKAWADAKQSLVIPTLTKVQLVELKSTISTIKLVELYRDDYFKQDLYEHYNNIANKSIELLVTKSNIDYCTIMDLIYNFQETAKAIGLVIDEKKY